MIEKEDEGYTIFCDSCSNDMFLNSTNFFDAVNLAKKNYWQISRKNSDWHHQCPECSSDKMFDVC